MNIIVAIGRQNEIGCENRLLWPIREDLRRFKTLTLGHPVIMGRNTWLSLPRRPLPGRLNIVVSENPEFEPHEQINDSDADSVSIRKATSLEEALEIAKDATTEVPFVIGGGRLYAAALPLAERVYLTCVEAVAPQADTFFPPLDPADWNLEAESPLHQTDSGLAYRFQTLTRK